MAVRGGGACILPTAGLALYDSLRICSAHVEVIVSLPARAQDETDEVVCTLV